jgi:hypothetical protein
MKKPRPIPRHRVTQEGPSSSDTVPSRIDTIVKCFEDVEHVSNGSLCIEDYTLEGMETSSMMCFASWGEQQCSSCTFSENVCYDNDTGRWQGGYKLICNNVFPNTRSMTICENRIQYNMRTSGSQTVVLIVILAVLLRGFMAWYFPSSSSSASSSSQSHSRLPYQSVPLDDNGDEEDGGDDSSSLTETSPSKKFGGNHHVAVD